MLFYLLLIITINVFIADGIILTESLLNQLGFSKSSSSINIDNPNITEIDTNAFKEYTNITWIHLRFNKLSTIDLKVFKSSSPKLIFIWISASTLTKLSNSENTKFLALQTLELDVNSLLSLDSEVINGLPNLTHLTVTNSFQLSPLNPNQLSSIGNLEYLRLVVKNQTSLSRAHFNGLTSLKTLEFQSSNIQKIDNDTFNGLTNLEVLNLRNNSLNQLDLSYVSGKLISLSLSLNNLSHLRMPKRLDNLTNLALSTNRFNSFRSIDFNNFPNLEYLLLSDNPQDNSSEIANYLKPLVKLSYANFRNMSIRGTIDSSFFKFNTKLLDIDLSYNRIEKISSNAFSNLKITQINLTNNLLTELDNSVFSGPKMLEAISLDNNKLANIGARTFNNLTMLYKLSLNNNSLSKLDDSALNGCNKLYIVYLYNNTNLQTSNLQNLCPKTATHCKVYY